MALRYFTAPLFLILFGVVSLHGQIRLVIQDEHGEALPYANTVLLNHRGEITSIGAASNDNGVVHYGMVKAGEYQLLIQTLGYIPDTIPNILITGTGRLIDLGIIQLAPEDYLLNEVVVTAKAPVIIREANQLIYNIEQTTMASGETALSLLTNVPGVIVNGRNDIVVNGKDNVLVMIDGRRQYGSPEEITSLLLSLSSESIRQVEVSSAASARYDASGSGAVINIVSKRSSYTGINGSTWVRYRQERYPSGYAGTNLNWKYRKFSGNLYYYFTYYQGFHDIDIERRVDSLGPGGQPVFFRERIEEHWSNMSHSPRAQFFYDVNDNHRLGIKADLSFLKIDFPKESVTRISDDGMGTDSAVVSDIKVKDKRVFPSVNLNYQALFAERSGIFDFAYDFFSYSYDLESTFRNQRSDSDLEPVGQPSVFRETSSLTNYVHTAAADISKSLPGDHRLEAGAKVTFIDKVSDTRVAIDDGGGFADDPDRARDFDYREDIYAGYANWSKEFPKNWTIGAGLRVEHTRVRQSSVQPESEDSRSYTDYFPVARVFNETGSGNTFSLSYARRTLRPTFDQLNPFILVINPYLVVSGDPDLIPQINNMLDVEFTFKKYYTVYGGYNLANHSINSVFLDEGGGVYNLTYRNFDRSHFANAGFSASVDIFDWWSVTSDVNAAYDHYNVVLEGQEIRRKGFSATVSVLNQFSIPGDFYIDLNAIYESPRYTSIEYFKSTGRIDITLTKYFFDKALNLKLRGRDLFYTSKFESELDYLNLESHYLERSGSRRIEFTITYNFNRGADFKPRRTRDSNTEEKERT